MPAETSGRRVDALIDSLVAEYFPAVTDRTEASVRAEELARKIEEVVGEVVGEEFGLGLTLEAKPHTTTSDEMKVKAVTEVRERVESELSERLHGKLWLRLVQPSFCYTDYISSKHFQTYLLQVQRELARVFATTDYDEINSAIFDIIRDSLSERDESRPPHPFRDLSRYDTENRWRSYFFTSAKRRYIRNLKKRGRVEGIGFVEAAEDPRIERALLDRSMAVGEIDNLPDTFTEAQKEILRHILHGHPIDRAPHYSEGYVRKVIRKAISYFRNRR